MALVNVLSGFMTQASQVRTPQAAEALLAQWAPTLSGQPFWVAEGAPGVRLATMLQAIIVALATVPKAQPAPKAQAAGSQGGAKRPPSPFFAVVGNRSGVLESKGFQSHYKAEEWALRRLAECGDPTAKAGVHERRTGKVTPYDRDTAVMRTWGRRAVRPGADRDTSVRNVNGPWMKAESDRATFSRG